MFESFEDIKKDLVGIKMRQNKGATDACLFITILHLANEKLLDLTTTDDYHNFDIKLQWLKNSYLY